MTNIGKVGIVIGHGFRHPRGKVGQAFEVRNGHVLVRGRRKFIAQRQAEDDPQVIAVPGEVDAFIEDRDDAVTECGVVGIVADLGKERAAEEDPRPGLASAEGFAGEGFQPLHSRPDDGGTSIELGVGLVVGRHRCSETLVRRIA